MQLYGIEKGEIIKILYNGKIVKIRYLEQILDWDNFRGVLLNHTRDNISFKEKDFIDITNTQGTYKPIKYDRPETTPNQLILIEALQAMFVKKLRISYISPKFKRKRDFESNDYNLEKVIKLIEVASQVKVGSDEIKIEYRTPYELRKGVPKALEGFRKNAISGDCMLWDSIQSDPIDPKYYKDFLKDIKKSVGHFWKGKESQFAKEAQFEQGDRVGCESYKDAVAEAWIDILENDVFEKASLKSNPQSYVYTAIQKLFKDNFKKGMAKITRVKNDDYDLAEYYSLQKFSTAGEEKENYGNSIAGIEQTLVSNALGVNRNYSPSWGYNTKYAEAVKAEPVKIYKTSSKDTLKLFQQYISMIRKLNKSYFAFDTISGWLELASSPYNEKRKLFKLFFNKSD